MDAVEKVLGPQEGICGAGVFVLKRQGWFIWQRRKFTQQGSASSWGKAECQKAIKDRVASRTRLSVVAEPESLDAVLAEYEERRKAGDPDFKDAR